MARIRTFIAVDVGDTIRASAVGLQRRLERTAAGVKWVEADNLHITLLFLGEVDELEVLRVCRAVAAVAQTTAPFTLVVEGLGAFPHTRRPKILWVGVKDGTEELRHLHEALEAPLLAMGAYRREERAYTPHLTLGRLSDEDRADRWAPVFTKHADWQAGETTVSEVLVMSSELRREGPVYTVLSRTQLGGAANEEAESET